MKTIPSGTNRNSDALRRVFRASMFSFGLPRADAHILTAFSGGSDSTALLYLLKQLSDAQRHPFAVSAIHVHHGIRGAEADRDARFCEAFCAEHSIPLRLEYADVPALAAESGRSLEEEAREVRYRLFAQHLAQNPDITHLTTAHHADDQAETVLFRLLRGTAVLGLSGIPQKRMLTVENTGNPEHPTREVALIRPLLPIRKQTLTAFLEENGIPYVTDSTNREDDASRNVLRNTLLPAAEAINPAFSDALLRTAQSACEDEDYFREEIRRFLCAHSVPDHADIAVRTEPLKNAHPALRRRILAVMYRQESDIKPLSQNCLDRMDAALRHPPQSISLPDRRMFSVGETVCAIVNSTAEVPSAPDYQPIPLPVGTPVRIPTGASCLLCDGSVNASENLQDLKNIYKFFISTHINSDKLLGSVHLRPRSSNADDRYLCGGSVKNARDALSAHHVPAEMRRQIPLVCDENGIVWVPFCGVRDDCNPRFAAPENTSLLDIYYFYNDEVLSYASGH